MRPALRPRLRRLSPFRRRSRRALAREIFSLRRGIRVLHRVAALVSGSLELDATCYAVLTGVTAGQGLGYHRAFLFLVDPEDRENLVGRAAIGPLDDDEADRVWKRIEAEQPSIEALYEAGLQRRTTPSPLDERVRKTRIAVSGPSMMARALREGRVVFKRGADDELIHETGIAAPMSGAHGAIGVLYADHPFRRRAHDDLAPLVFEMVAQQAGRAIEASFAYERIALRARTDALTGLGHHGAMMDELRATLESATERGTSPGLCMVDLDDFKRVNDEYGHLAGDALLVGIASRMRRALRRDAKAFRYGGEEFAVVVQDAGEEELRRLAERLRTVVCDQPFALRKGLSLPVTCSVGIASFDAKAAPDDATLALVDAADQALLAAKAAGKNRVLSAPRKGGRVPV